jgi:hypothetical protein
MMLDVRLWKGPADPKGWRQSLASVGVEERGHMLADLLEGNLMGKEECEQLISECQKSLAAPTSEFDYGFGNSVGIYFKQGMAMLDHVVPSYGEFTLPAGELIKVVQEWQKVLLSKGPMECQLQIEV